MARTQSSRTRRARAFVTAAALGGALAAFAASSDRGALPPAEAQDRTPRLVFEHRSYDFGAITQGALPKARFAFRNTGLGRLRITRVRAACGCTTPVLERRNFDFGEGDSIVVELDTRGRSGFLEKTLAVESNDPREPRVILTIKARIRVPPRPVLGLESTDIELGRFESGGAFAFTLRNPGQKRLEVGLFRPNKALRFHEPPPWSLPPGAALILRGQVRFEDQAGRVETTAYLSSNDPNRRVTPLRFQAYRPPQAGPRLEADRPGLDFGALKESESATRRLSLINRGDRPFELKGIQAPAGFQARLEPERIAPGGEARLTVIREPVAAGKPDQDLRADLVLVGSETRTPLPLSAFLRPSPSRPRLRLTVQASAPKPIDWRLGVLDADQAAVASIKVVNDGPGPLLLAKALPAPRGFTLHRMGSSKPTPPGGTVELLLSARSGALPARIDERVAVPIGAASLQIRVRGRVRIAGPRLALPESLVLGDLIADQPRRFTLPLVNTGDEPLPLRNLSGQGFGADSGLELDALPVESIPPGSRALLTLRFRGRRELGPLQASLRLGVGDPRNPRRSVKISGWVLPPEKARKLRLLYHSDEAGVLEPCGCGGKEQLGGLPRLASALEDGAEKKHELRLSAGDLAGGAGELYRRRFRSAAAILGSLDYAALAPGELDLALGVEALKEAAREAELDLICANLSLKGAPLFPPSKIVDRAGLRVALIGLIDPELAAAARVPGLAASDPEAALRSELERLSGSFDLCVLLAHTGEDKARRLAESGPEVDVVIVGHGRGAGRQRVKNTRLVWAADAGKRLGLLELYLRDGGLRAEENRVIPLDARWPDQGAAAAALRRYRLGLRDLPPAAQRAPRPEERYAGAEACVDCHEEETAVWRASLHAVAMESLEPGANDFDPKCTGCHSVGQGRPGGFRRRDLSPALLHVQCESCHGPGAAHAANPRAQGGEEGVAMPALGGEESCRSCHNGEHSPSFRWPEYWRRIAHGPRARLQFWDGNKNGVLDVDEKARRKAFIAAEARRTQESRGGKH